MAGYIGPCGLDARHTVLYDRSLAGAGNLAGGANRHGFHYTGFTPARELGDVEYHDLSKVRDGGLCPQCGKAALTISRGIEVGNIFQLGDKYTRPMGMQYAGGDGEQHPPVMGCYGIGVGRLAASVCEARHDENGPIWPAAIAPWQVALCCLRADDEKAKSCADELYGRLTEAGLEVLYDDRSVSAGVMFSDADLFGLPVRVIVSPRNVEAGRIEVAARDKSWQELVPVDELVEAVKKRLA